MVEFPRAMEEVSEDASSEFTLCASGAVLDDVVLVTLTTEQGSATS